MLRNPVNRFYKFIAPLVIVSLVVFIFPREVVASTITRIPAQNASGTGVASATATYGSTPTQGDLLISVACADTAASFTTTPSGWTQIFDTTAGTSQGELDMYYKVAGASEPTGVTYALTGAGSMNVMAFEYTGNTSVSVFDKFSTNSAGLTSSLVADTATSPATTQASELAFAAACWPLAAQTLSAWSNSFSAITSVASHNFVSEKFLTVTGTQQTTLTVTGTTQRWAAGVATFKAQPGPFHALVTISNASVFDKAQVVIS